MPEAMALEFFYSQRNDGQYLSKTPKERPFPIAKDMHGREMLTASEGYYDENKDIDTVMRVGRVVYHLKADSVVAILPVDSTGYRQDLPSRWMSEDPVKHPYQSPYVGFNNNPIFLIDPNGTSAGRYLDQETGSEIHNDGIDDNKVYMVSMSAQDAQTFKGMDSQKRTNFLQANTLPKNGLDLGNQKSSNTDVRDLTRDMDLTYTDLLNRTHWIYGEGAGTAENKEGFASQRQAARAYAHVQANVYSDNIRQNDPEKVLFDGLLNLGPGKSGLNLLNSAEFTSNNKGPYGIFYQARLLARDRPSTNHNSITSNTVNHNTIIQQARGSGILFSEIMKAVSGVSKDPTQGANQWRGGDKAYEKVSNYKSGYLLKTFSSFKSSIGRLLLRLQIKSIA